MVELTSLEVLQFPIEGAVVEFNISEDSLNYIFNDVFKVTKIAEMAMYGTGVTYFEEQIYWLVKNLGIVKQQLWYHWGDGSIYPPVLGTEWTMSSYSESDVNSSASGLVFTSLDEFAQAVGFEKYKFKRSAGLKKLEPVN